MARIIPNAAWVTYTPTISAPVGTFTSVSATGRYCRQGKICHIQIQVIITTNGTAAGRVVATLPFTSAAFAYVITGGERAVTGSILQGLIEASTSQILIRNPDNSYPGGNGCDLVMSGFYEVA